MSKQWLQIVNQGSETTPGEILISGPIGSSFWDDSATSSKQFRDALSQFPKGRKINLKINSEGGVIQDGLDMYDAVRSRRDDITAIVIGYGCSTASWFFLPACKVVTSNNALWMIHKSASQTWGNADEHAKMVECLNKHDESIAGMISQKTGKSVADIMAAMEKETWLTGTEAKDFGLADELIDGEENAANKIHVRNRLQNFALNKAQVTTQNQIMKRDEIIALLKKHGATVPENATDKELLDLLNQQLEKPKSAKVEDPAPEPQPEPAPAPSDDLKSEIENLKQEVKALKNRPVALSHPRIEPVSESALDKIKNLHKTAKARFTAMKEDWNALYAAECASDRARSAQVMNSNTYSATLVTAFLVDGFVTDLQNRWAMLKAFSMDFTVDAFKPLASAVLSHVTAGATTQTDATNFESGNSTVGAISATMHQYTQSFQVSNADLQSGLRMEKLVAINSANFANKVTEVATVPITTAIFTATPITRAAAAFDFTDLATLQGQLKKSPIKNLILDGSYIARIANTPGFFQTAGVVGGDTGAWKAFGWDLIAQLTDWTGAGANVQGFACNPQAIAGITGLPVQPPNVPGGILSQQVISVPELGVSILVSDWFNPSTRTSWRSFDIMAGFHEVDTTAGVVIQSQ